MDRGVRSDTVSQRSILRKRHIVFSLAGKKALVLGIANEDSIAFGCAKAFRAQGVNLAITFQNEKAESYVRPLAEKLEADIVLPLDVREDGQFGHLFDSIRRTWGQVDICLHSIAFCPKQDLQSRVVDCSHDGFVTAMDISVYSFIRMVRRAEPLMPGGGVCMTVSFFGAEKVVEHYNIMGPVKAALESATRYMAADLGPKGIRVHALSPGPLKTRAASGIGHFDELLNQAAARAPTHQLATIEDVGAYAVFLASAEAANVTGGIHYIDGGYHVVG
jgi:enoyl-[acyl-carrier protein] reductase I